MEIPTLFRRRLIPEEYIELKDDQILHCSEEVIVTSWHALHPKPDLDHGSSAYFLDKGIKVSRFLRADGSLIYWYCDIVNYRFEDEGRKLVITDLLADVVIYPDGFVKVMDLDELVTAFKQNLITSDDLQAVLLRTDELLKTIYSGDFHIYQDLIRTVCD